MSHKLPSKYVSIIGKGLTYLHMTGLGYKKNSDQEVF